MSSLKKQVGFSLIEVLLVIAVIGLIAFLGYSFATRQAEEANSEETSQSAVADDVPTAPEIKSTDDLDKASAMLDQVDTSSSEDFAELDSQLQEF